MSGNGYWRQLAAAGLVIAGAGAIQLAGGLVELARLGVTDDAAFAGIERQATQRFETMAAALETLAVRLAARPAVMAGLRGEPNSAAALFDAVRAAPADSAVADAAITVYDDMGAARAWTGRPSEIALERILGGQTFFVAPGSLGLRLVYIEPLHDAFSDSSPPPRIGSIAAEFVLSPALGVTATPAGPFNLRTTIADVSVRATGAAGDRSTRQPDDALRFDLLSPRGGPLLEASVAVTDLRMTRIRWRRAVTNLTLLFVALAIIAAVLIALRRLPRGGPPLNLVGRAALAVAGLGAPAFCCGRQTHRKRAAAGCSHRKCTAPACCRTSCVLPPISWSTACSPRHWRSSPPPCCNTSVPRRGGCGARLPAARSCRFC